MIKKQNLFKRAALDYQNVKLRESRLLHSRSLELRYLEELDADKLLSGFRKIAGLPEKATPYGGWEVLEIKGHTLGHYLTALAQAYGETGLLWLKERIAYILSELKDCQAEDGYLFASPRDYFDRVEKKQPIWVPWYTMHKIIQGLLAAYEFTALEGSLTILKKLSGWISTRCDSWDEKTHKTVLALEYGGMNDCLYDLYQIWPDPAVLRAAHAFDEEELFEKLHENEDILDGLHANTTIPKILGALKRYIVLGEEQRYYREVAENFWEMVVSHHTYLTGGNSEWEHFGKPGVLAAERTNCNCETCNSYNMLKMTKLLYQITGDQKYADFYERAFINSILSSQNKETGMTTYFQPMATGYFKVFGTPFDRFWCCIGTGMENFTKLTEGIYYQNGTRLYINQFFSSEVIWEECNGTVTLEADLLKSNKIVLSVKPLHHAKVERNEKLEIALRLPDWLTQEPGIETASSIQIKKEEGYLILSGNFNCSQEITVCFPMKLQCNALPDQPDVVGFTYGPFVLSADLGSEDLKTDVTGIEVSIPTREMEISEELILTPEIFSEIQKNPEACFKPSFDSLEFELFDSGHGRKLIFTPHYLQDTKRYGIYFKLTCGKQ